MVGYGESLLFITDKPVEQSEFLFDSLALSKNKFRYDLFQEYKSEWLRWMVLHGNDDVCDDDFYETNKEILTVDPFSVPLDDKMYSSSMSGISKVLLNSFGSKYVYLLYSGNFSFFYDTNFDYSDYEQREQTICKLRGLCSKELFEWLIYCIKERMNNGSEISRLVCCYSGTNGIMFNGTKNVDTNWGLFDLYIDENEISNCDWIDLDIDKIEIPDNSFKYFSDEFQKRGLEFSGYNFGINFYRETKP